MLAIRQGGWRPTAVGPSSDAWTQSVSCWVHTCVVGLELCPWAAAAAEGGMRLVVEQGDEGAVLNRMGEELRLLADTADIERATTLVATPGAFESFSSFLDGAEAINQMIKARKLAGVLQLATFHPSYQFAGTEEEDASNYTNRSPVPIFHLLRESEVSRALRGSRLNADDIWSANVARSRALGPAQMSRLVGSCKPVHPRG